VPFLERFLEHFQFCFMSSFSGAQILIEWEYCSPHLIDAAAHPACRESNVYSDDRYNRMCLRRTYRLLEVGRDFPVNSTGPLHFKFQFWCSWIACFWSYSFPNVASESIKDRKIACIFGLHSMLLLWCNSRRVFGKFGKLRDPAAMCSILVVVVASGTERCRWLSTRSRNL